MKATAASLAAVALALSLGTAMPAHAGKKDNSIRLAANQVPESLDAYFNNVRIGVILAHHIWDHLVSRDPKTNEYKPSLATAWRWVDNQTLEFDLRKGVKFHNGEPFDADDVVYTLNFVSKPENKSTTQQNRKLFASMRPRSTLTRCASRRRSRFRRRSSTSPGRW